ncbi:Uracil-DNA glycosylase [Providencia stuartii]|nr:Uracil-DNA glycosylase [Providencia stuartii]
MWRTNVKKEKLFIPPQQDVFNAFRYTELADVKVVILGQDPYHGPGQAHGLSFSVLPGIKPPSLIGQYVQRVRKRHP